MTTGCPTKTRVIKAIFLLTSQWNSYATNSRNSLPISRWIFSMRVPREVVVEEEVEVEEETIGMGRHGEEVEDEEEATDHFAECVVTEDVQLRLLLTLILHLKATTGTMVRPVGRDGTKAAAVVVAARTGQVTRAQEKIPLPANSRKRKCA